MKANVDPFASLSSRARNLVKKLGIETVEQLKDVSFRDILYSDGIGPGTAAEIIRFIWNRL